MDGIPLAEDYRKKRLKNQTKPERRFAGLLGNHKFKFEQEKIVEYGNGRFFIVDFYLTNRRLCIEIDGSSHKGKEDYDKAREQVLNSLGYQVRRFSNKRVMGQGTKSFFEMRNYRRKLRNGAYPRSINEPCPSCKETFGHSKFCLVVIRNQGKK